MKRKTKRTALIIAGAAFVAIIAVIIVSARSRNSNKTQEEEIRTARVRETEFISSVDVSGYLEAADVQKVQFRSTGAITGVFVEVGDKVVKGQLLATIDDTQQRRNLIKAQQEIDRQKATASEKEMELLKLDLQIAENNMEYTKAVANFEGEVTEVNIRVGDYSEAATTLNLMQVVDKSYLKAHVEVDEMDARNLHEGMEILLNFDSLPNQPVKAIVHYIPYLGSYDTSSGIGVKKIEIRIYDPPDGIYPGYSFSSTIESASSSKYLLIQSSAIKSNRGKSYLIKRDDDGSFRQVEVTVRYMGEGLSQLLSGDVKAGDEYALNPASLFNAGGFGQAPGAGPGGGRQGGGGSFGGGPLPM